RPARLLQPRGRWRVDHLRNCRAVEKAPARAAGGDPAHRARHRQCTWCQPLRPRATRLSALPPRAAQYHVERAPGLCARQDERAGLRVLCGCARCARTAAVSAVVPFSRGDALHALGVVVIWGLNFVVMKLGLQTLSPMLLGALRFMAASLPFLLF